jgi:hypothetical protein
LWLLLQRRLLTAIAVERARRLHGLLLLLLLLLLLGVPRGGLLGVASTRLLGVASGWQLPILA